MFKYFSKLLALVLVCLLLVPAPLIVAAEGNTEHVQIILDSANQSKIKSDEKGMFIFYSFHP
ncbi:hypothetical protein [Paenibacillus sp. NRS-1760]|uniref:hypothetical protein n=1 Tax=Paenibacillus sp. NRS-1760 TaxID=3233902 RepID=UPI003D2824EB